MIYIVAILLVISILFNLWGFTVIHNMVQGIYPHVTKEDKWETYTHFARR